MALPLCLAACAAPIPAACSDSAAGEEGGGVEVKRRRLGDVDRSGGADDLLVVPGSAPGSRPASLPVACPAMTRSSTAEAERLEAEAVEYPDDRGEILLEAAAEWRRSGRPDRAHRLLSDLAAEGGEDGCYARCQLVGWWFEDGEDAQAVAGLALLAADPALHDGHCLMAAELLVGQGDRPEALRWFDRAVARLAPERLEALRGPDGWTDLSAAMVLWQRRDLRQELGLPMDATDDLVPEPPPAWPPTWESVADEVASGRVPDQIRMLVFQRAERAEARRRWPQEYTDDDEEHFPAAEARWRGLADAGVPSIRVVPVTVDALEAFARKVGGSPTDSAVKSRFANTVPERETIAWPPSRNSPCWCGAPVKYKKCCGRVSTQ
jgi:tetratricopeptide (TPR) repeat protein